MPIKRLHRILLDLVSQIHKEGKMARTKEEIEKEILSFYLMSLHQVEADFVAFVIASSLPAASNVCATSSSDAPFLTSILSCRGAR